MQRRKLVRKTVSPADLRDKLLKQPNNQSQAWNNKAKFRGIKGDQQKRKSWRGFRNNWEKKSEEKNAKKPKSTTPGGENCKDGGPRDRNSERDLERK